MGAFAWGSATGHKPVLPISVGASMVALGTIFFALNVFMRLRRTRSADTVREVAP
jgi:hypothetical protein